MKTRLSDSDKLVYWQCLRAYQRSDGPAERYPVIYLTRIDGDLLTLCDETGPVAVYSFVREEYGIRIRRVPLENQEIDNNQQQRS